MRFSERHGYKTLREIIQIESVDEPLRSALWSLLKVFVWDHARHSGGGYGGGYYLTGIGNEELKKLCRSLWFNYFKKPLDQLDNDWTETLKQLRRYFFECQWFEVYDFIEFVANNFDRYGFRERFIESCNGVLQTELSAYKFVDGLITRITEQQEIEEIETALETARGPSRTHLRRALELLSDRNAPDYRNSIKESISSLESLVAAIVGEKGTLGHLIKKLDNEIGLHPALKTAFSNLYGYTSDEGGIRHALMEAEKVDFNDAKFMLVVCSAFVNFVLSKVEASG